MSVNSRYTDHSNTHTNAASTSILFRGKRIRDNEKWSKWQKICAIATREKIWNGAETRHPQHTATTAQAKQIPNKRNCPIPVRVVSCMFGGALVFFSPNQFIHLYFGWVKGTATCAPLMPPIQIQSFSIANAVIQAFASFFKLKYFALIFLLVHIDGAWEREHISHSRQILSVLLSI